MESEDKIFSFTVPYCELIINASDILSDISNNNEKAASHILPEIHSVILELEKHTSVNAGFRIVDENKVIVEKDSIIFGEYKFNSGSVINSQLKGITSFAVFVASIGDSFDKWCNELFTENPMHAFLADMIGSALVESAADWIELKVTQLLKDQGIKCTNRFSPGYCGWNVGEQKTLFALLPEKFCGISLNESALMIPKKSVSGIIGIGKNVEKKKYLCKICNLENCYRRKL